MCICRNVFSDFVAETDGKFTCRDCGELVWSNQTLCTACRIANSSCSMYHKIADLKDLDAAHEAEARLVDERNRLLKDRPKGGHAFYRWMRAMGQVNREIRDARAAAEAARFHNRAVIDAQFGTDLVSQDPAFIKKFLEVPPE